MKFLIIEDDKETIDFLKSSLKDEGFLVDTAEDGEEGLYKAQINTYDLIILDKGLPKKNGLQVCSELRNKGKSIPIIILSVESDAATKTDLLNIGADDYLSKPFSFAELLARIKALLRRPEKIEDNILKVGDLTLDVNGRKIKWKNKEIYFTNKEFMLLEYLMKNRGRVLSRAEILEHIWDVNADPFTNTIETHILNIRKKIQGSKNKLIRTIPLMGYKID